MSASKGPEEGFLPDSGHSNPSEFTALLGKGASFDGKLVFEGVVRIDGKFRGDIFTRDTLIIGSESRVEARIDADTVVVAGYVEGQIRATSRVEIQTTGYVRGSIQSPIFKIEEGGMFDGTTQMVPNENA
ncbi:MAG: polymer-forming cytoskeletal protein [Bdellovibrionales bacterium]|nr:polymer-forming cytoskeletal protein [Bdellovibrionales bacterium]